jgi:hypothetical protein
METNGVNQKLILDFNDSTLSADSNNFLTIMKNMSPFSEYDMMSDGTKTKVRLNTISEPPIYTQSPTEGDDKT